MGTPDEMVRQILNSKWVINNFHHVRNRDVVIKALKLGYITKGFFGLWKKLRTMQHF